MEWVTNAPRLPGDYPYCNDFLVLPVEPAATAGNLETLHVRMLLHIGKFCVEEPELSDLIRGYGTGDWRAPDASTLFWFRWVTGHQLACLFWTCLCALLSAATQETNAQKRDAALACAAKVEAGYSAMLVYAASCPRHLYLSHFRRFMFLHHKAFSGKWARDYLPIRRLFKALSEGERPSIDEYQGTREFHSRFVENQQVHQAVAEKLVPEGESLRQDFQAQFRSETLVGVTEHERFDYFFLIKRASTDAVELSRAVALRHRAIRLDLCANGLFPPAHCRIEEFPETLRIGNLASYWREFSKLVDNASASCLGVLSTLDQSSYALPDRQTPESVVAHRNSSMSQESQA